MANSVYKINKGINRPIEFKGIKAQYLWYLAGGLIGLLLLFAALYFMGANTYATLIIVVNLAIGLFACVRRLSNKYGEHGMMKKVARRVMPQVIKSRSRNISGFALQEKSKGGKA